MFHSNPNCKYEYFLTVIDLAVCVSLFNMVSWINTF
jgi:hypothetical protein